jgi:hypothetical protein
MVLHLLNTTVELLTKGCKKEQEHGAQRSILPLPTQLNCLPRDAKKSKSMVRTSASYLLELLTNGCKKEQEHGTASIEYILTN